MKQIVSILNNSDAVQIVEIFRQNISQLDKEIKEELSTEELNNASETLNKMMDKDVPGHLIKRKFNGGMYAAHVLKTWDFQDWRLLKEWVDSSDKYDNAWGEPRWTPDETGSGQGFEEQLNYWGNASHGFRMEDMQLDLLFPIREK